MSENMRIYDASRSVPKEALKPIIGGRLKGMSDINPMWRIKMLTELFGICGIGWKVEITDKRLENGASNEIVCFVDINLYVKVEGEWSAPIPGMGGSSFVTMERNGPYTSDECFKMSYTDAISVACKSLGFAADVYFEKDRTKYSTQSNDPETGVQEVTDMPPSDSELNNLQSTPPPAQKQSNGRQETAAQLAAKVYKLREEMGWTWAQLNEYCQDVLNRPVKFLKKDVTDVEDWKKIESLLSDYHKRAS